jgi:hypothetical protein
MNFPTATYGACQDCIERRGHNSAAVKSDLRKNFSTRHIAHILTCCLSIIINRILLTANTNLRFWLRCPIWVYIMQLSLDMPVLFPINMSPYARILLTSCNVASHLASFSFCERAKSKCSDRPFSNLSSSSPSTLRVARNKKLTKVDICQINP